MADPRKVAAASIPPVRSKPPLELPPTDDFLENDEPQDPLLAMEAIRSIIRNGGGNMGGVEVMGRELPSGGHVETWAPPGKQLERGPGPSNQTPLTSLDPEISDPEISDKWVKAVRKADDLDLMSGFENPGGDLYIEQSLLKGPDGDKIRMLAERLLAQKRAPKTPTQE